MTSQLVGSDFSDGALLPNYVNGRLLVAEDLATAQSSLRLRDTRIGEAAGAGVARGLWVVASGTKLKVQPGLAIGGSGAPVLVVNPVVLELSFAITGTTSTAGTFSCCQQTTDGEGSALTTGSYVLTARPACKLEGSAPLAPAPGQTLSPCCVAQWQVEGVEFRVIALPLGDTVDGITITAGNRRNLVAHWCFGTEQLATLGADPFGFDPAYAGLDSLDPADLTANDVPLAVFGWDGSTVADLDNWSVRRRITTADPVPSAWTASTADRREADGQARFLQFQDQADALVSASLAASAVASDYFGLLPPVGFLPVRNGDLKRIAGQGMAQDRLFVDTMTTAPPALSTMPADTPSDPATTPTDDQLALAAETFLKFKNLLDVVDTTVGYGFDPATFFGRLARYGGMVHWDVAEWALQQSWRLGPVSTDLDTNPTDTAANDTTAAVPRIFVNRAPITYYYVVENLDAATNTLANRRISLLNQAAAAYRLGFVRSRLYIVFMADQAWVTGTDLPLVADLSRQAWSGIGQ